jgi:hypothetical protein
MQMADVRTRLAVLAAVAAAVCGFVAFHETIAQPQDYHNFADQRTVWGIPNFWNVVSNVPFLLVGWAGCAVLGKRAPSGMLPALDIAYRCFFVGALLVAFGSAYYHLVPSNQSLVWDRLPMTIVFMALFSVIIGEHIDLRVARWLLFPLLVIGVASVVYWHWSEEAGHGDLRPYLVVQFLPMALMPLILLMFPSRLTHVRLIWGVLGAYVLAKLFELGDTWIYDLFRMVSGHTIKHLVAALGLYLFLMAIKNRRVLK